MDNFDMSTAISAMKDAFTEYYKGEAGADSRQRTLSGTSVLNTMPAFMNKYSITGLKTYIGTKSGARFVVLLFDSNSNELIALIEANRLGQVRTGAVTALATSILHKNCVNFALIGSGYQAETQLEGILTVSDPEEIRVYSKTPAHSKEFADTMSKKFGRDIKFSEELRTVLRDADVISSITSSHEPILTDLSFLENYHLNLAGSNVLHRREASESVIGGADLVVVEHLEQAFRESSEITDFVESGGKPVELKTVVGEPEDYSTRKRTIFKSMGIGLEDIVSAHYLLKKMNLV